MGEANNRGTFDDRKAQALNHKKNIAFANMVILSASSEEGPWSPVKPDDVPNWLKDMDVMSQLVDGFMCNDPEESETWYRAERFRIQH